MPFFRSYKNTHKFGKVKVTPKGIRRINVNGYSVFPYVTMNKICFSLHVERLPQQDGINKRNQYIYIQFGDGSYRYISTISTNKTDVEGTVTYTGDTKFFIAPASYSIGSAQKHIAKEGLLIFEDNVLSINHYIIWVGGIFAGAIFSLLCLLLSFLLGFIKLVPFWEMWLSS